MTKGLRPKAGALAAVFAGIFLGADVAFADDRLACVVSLDANSRVDVETQADDPFASPQLCVELKEVIKANPNLLDALARNNARITLHLQEAGPNRLVAYLALHADGAVQRGQPLTLDQVDAGKTGFSPLLLNRFARHLLTTPPFSDLVP